MKGFIDFLAVLLIIALLSGCSLQNVGAPVQSTAEKSSVSDDTGNNSASADTVTQTTSTVNKVTLTLYFPDSGNDAILKESREAEVVDGAIIKAAVSALMDGPSDSKLRNAFPEGTKLLGVNLKDGTAILDFTGEFNQAMHTAGIVLRASIANTLTEIDGIEKIRILIDGSPQIALSGLPYEDMGKVPLDDQGRPLPD